MAVAVRVAVVGSVLAGACAGGGGDEGGGGGGDRPGATVPEGDSSPTSSSTPPSSTSTSIDISAKPATVTVEYADAVMDELDRILSDAIREFVAADGPTKAFDDKLNAVYDEPSLENQRSDFGRDAVDGMHLYRRPPGNVRTVVVGVLKADPDCVVISVDRTFAETLADPKPRSRTQSYVAWEPTDEQGDPEDLNPTPWSIVFDGNVLEGEEPRNAC